MLSFILNKICVTGFADDLKVLVEGENRTAAAISENVTLICTVPSRFHSWRVPERSITETLEHDTPPTMSEISGIAFSTRVLSVNPTSIETSFSFLAVEEINNTLIECKDTFGVANVTQTARILISG